MLHSGEISPGSNEATSQIFLYRTVSRIVANHGVVHIALKHEAIVVGFFWCMRLCTTLTLACRCCGCAEIYELNALRMATGRLSAQHAMLGRDSAQRLVKTSVTHLL